MELRTSEMVASALSSESDDDGSAFLLVPSHNPLLPLPIGLH
jgi:hypothetical protein